MTAKEHQKRKIGPPLEQREGLRKTAKVRTGELCCPICEVTLWPETVEQHYKQELAKLCNTTTLHSKKRQASSSSTGTANKEGRKEMRERKLFQHAHQVLESVRRHHILFQQELPSTRPHLTSSQPGPSSNTCPVCESPLSPDENLAHTHVNNCLGTGGEEDSSDGETYEEYTWCNVTRVRATSMLSPEARANMFDGTVISKGDASFDDVVDVEADETGTYGPAQFDEKDVKLCGIGDENKNAEGTKSIHCLICMDNYHRPLVSIKCWHVYCEKCWLQALANKKLCPKCKNITSSADLRKVYL